jgi:RNA polymerase sigma-70 factor, ECF subfamily
MTSPQPPDNSDETQHLLGHAHEGDQEAWARIHKRYERRLHAMLKLRLDPWLQRRIDIADIMQNVFLAAFLHLDDYLRDGRMSFYLWLRGIAANKLAEQIRFHNRIIRNPAAEVSSLSLADMFPGPEPRPSELVRKREERDKLHQALERMDSLDRDVLALRHFEELSNAETAQVLGLTETAASKRYARALLKLREILT